LRACPGVIHFENGTSSVYISEEYAGIQFLVDRDGNVVARFEPTEDMKKVEKEVAELL
jgi:glutathione peroxidase-family protein